METIRQRWIPAAVAGKSFIEVGGLWGVVNEQVTIAHDCGATTGRRLESDRLCPLVVVLHAALRRVHAVPRRVQRPVHGTILARSRDVLLGLAKLNRSRWVSSQKCAWRLTSLRVRSTEWPRLARSDPAQSVS